MDVEGAAAPDPARGVYAISVAAELAGTGVQNLRAYEARGLLTPERTAGGTRRYSADDIDRLRRIGDLLEAGLNLAGIAMVLPLQDENTQLRSESRTRTEKRQGDVDDDDYRPEVPHRPGGAGIDEHP